MCEEGGLALLNQRASVCYLHPRHTHNFPNKSKCSLKQKTSIKTSAYESLTHQLVTPRATIH